MAQQQGLLGPVRPQHGAGYQLLDGLLGGWVSYPERVRTAQAQRQSAMGAGQDLLSMFAAPEATAQAPGQALNAGTNPAMQAPATMPDMSDPGTIQRILRAKMMGAQGADMAMDALKANQPDIAIGPDGRPYNKRSPQTMGMQFRNPTNINGTIADLNNPENENRYIPEAPVKGANPVYDNRGRVVDWSMPGGALGAIGAAKGAEAAGQAPYEFITTPTLTGAPQVHSKATAAGGVFTGQSPVEAKFAGAATDARLGLPQKTSQAQTALNLIDKITAHPALANRTGLSSLVPALPGSPAADFAAMSDQLKGQVFMEAYSTLRGGGQITEQEGKKATDAIARLNARQSEKGYREALADLRSVIAAGAQRATAAAGGGAQRPPASAVQAEIARRKAAGLM